MSVGINDNVFFAATQLRVTFVDHIGNKKIITGSGFALSTTNNVKCIVTNKHNLDPTLKLGRETPFRLKQVEIMHREQTVHGWSDKTEFFLLSSLDEIRHSQSADVSVIYGDYYSAAQRKSFYLLHLVQSAIAEGDFFKKLGAMDTASFVGFPASQSTQLSWWDTSWNLPIARTVNIASMPHIPFTNSSIATGDVTLVSGLSFGGSSGSIILSHQKGIPPFSGDVTLHDPNYTSAKVIGIMSGHWQEPLPDMFVHTGLSYFTRSTSILELL